MLRRVTMEDLHKVEVFLSFVSICLCNADSDGGNVASFSVWCGSTHFKVYRIHLSEISASALLLLLFFLPWLPYQSCAQQSLLTMEEGWRKDARNIQSELKRLHNFEEVEELSTRLSKCVHPDPPFAICDCAI